MNDKVNFVNQTISLKVRICLTPEELLMTQEERLSEAFKEI